MGVELGRCERSVPQQLLNGSQVGPSLEQMRRRGVTQRMRSEVGSSVHFSQPSVNRPTNCTLIYPRAACAQEHAPAPDFAPTSEGRPRSSQRIERAGGRQPVRDRALLGALAHDPDAAGDRGRGRRGRARTARRRGCRWRRAARASRRRGARSGPSSASAVSSWPTSCGRSTSAASGAPFERAQQQARVGRGVAALAGEGGEDPRRRARAGPSVVRAWPGGPQPGQPAAQHPDVEVVDVGDAHAAGMVEQRRRRRPRRPGRCAADRPRSTRRWLVNSSSTA